MIVTKNIHFYNSYHPGFCINNANSHSYLLFIVCVQCEKWLLKNKFFFNSNTHLRFWCHCIWHHPNRIELSNNSNLKEEKAWLLGTKYRPTTLGNIINVWCPSKLTNFIKDKTYEGKAKRMLNQASPGDPRRNW